MGDFEDEFLNDVALVSGATFIDSEKLTLEDLKIEHLGTARKVTVSAERTKIIDGEGKSKDISKWIEKIIEDMENEERSRFKKVYRDWLTRLGERQAIIGVGGRTEVE